MGRVSGKVALVTGAARGQGRSHAVELAKEGAKIVATDVGTGTLPGVEYPVATSSELEETARLVREVGGEIITGEADVRDPDAIQAVVDAGIERFGFIDVVVANAGVFTWVLRRSSPGRDGAPLSTST